MPPGDLPALAVNEADPYFQPLVLVVIVVIGTGPRRGLQQVRGYQAFLLQLEETLGHHLKKRTVKTFSKSLNL